MTRLTPEQIAEIKARHEAECANQFDISDIFDDRERLLSHIESDGWQTMETLTEKHGDVLFLCPGYKGKRHQMVGCLTPGGEYRSWPARIKYDPTHWRPLPAPPETKEG